MRNTRFRFGNSEYRIQNWRFAADILCQPLRLRLVRRKCIFKLNLLTTDFLSAK
jgi:hypothetical protein